MVFVSVHNRDIYFPIYISQTTVFMVACGYLNGMMYAIVYTLFAPILSDMFGFTVEYTSYFFIGISCAFLATSFIQ